MATAMHQAMEQPKGRILFIDDNLDMRDMVGVLLSQAGYEVVSASTFSEGLGLAKAESFDLIMLDWHFQGGTGIELCRTIRRFDPKTPLFFYTGVAVESEIHKALEAGAQGCFIKPVEVNHLLATISTEMRNGHRGGSHEEINQ